MRSQRICSSACWHYFMHLQARQDSAHPQPASGIRVAADRLRSAGDDARGSCNFGRVTVEQPAVRGNGRLRSRRDSGLLRRGVRSRPRRRSGAHRISVDDVVRLHSSAKYYVCFLGFTAGFAYLGGLPEGLHTPRLSTPRRMVAGGSVGIAGGQTGIYPTETPGGWRLIGRTPLRMFDPQAQSPTRLQPGDRVQFLSIDRATFERLQQERG